jgi:hypothetical protein
MRKIKISERSQSYTTKIYELDPLLINYLLKSLNYFKELLNSWGKHIQAVQISKLIVKV